MHPKITHCCEAPRYMLSNYLGTFGEIWHIKIQMYPQTFIGPNNGAFNLNNEVSAHGLVLLFQLKWRVAPPCDKTKLWEKKIENYNCDKT